MSEDPFADTTEEPDGSFLEVTIKGGAYQSHVITARKPNFEELEKALAGLIKTVVGAQASLESAIKASKDFGEAIKSEQYGKPKGASTSVNTDIPFANSGSSSKSASKAPTCIHGPRELVEYKGQSGWICVKPKGDPERCVTVPGV